jgi:TetR/AcrR family transcriptional regulator
LLDAALEEFAAQGFAGARVRDIAERAGVSKDLIAYHFGGKEGLYLAVQRTWLDRGDILGGGDLPLGELLTRYLHDALTDPRPMRLLAWRGLAGTGPGSAPPDGAPETGDLSRTRARQLRGELSGRLDPATLRLVLLAAVAAPVIFPDATRKLFGIAASEPEFEQRYARGLQSLVEQLAPQPATQDLLAAESDRT